MNLITDDQMENIGQLEKRAVNHPYKPKWLIEDSDQPLRLL